MLAYYFHHGFVVVINADDAAANEARAVEIATRQFKESRIADLPSIMGVATLPQDGVVTAWIDHRSPQGDQREAAQRAAQKEWDDVTHQLANTIKEYFTQGRSVWFDDDKDYEAAERIEELLATRDRKAETFLKAFAGI
jgi:hypothetical protein